MIRNTLRRSSFCGLASLFQRRFLRSLFFATLGTAGILSLLIWLVQSLRYCGMMAYQGLSLHDVFLLSCHFLPSTVVIGTSWGFVVALIWVYRRWTEEKAFDIMRSCGVSPSFFLQPALFLSIFLTAFLYVLTLYWGPLMSHISTEHQQRVQKRFDPSFITAGIFFSIQGRTLYVHHQPSRYHLQGVFLHDHRNPKREFILCGQSAYITPHEYGFRMRFENGSMHIFPMDSPPYLAHFKRYTLNYMAPVSKGHSNLEMKKPEEESLMTLWNAWKNRSFAQRLFSHIPLQHAVVKNVQKSTEKEIFMQNVLQNDTVAKKAFKQITSSHITSQKMIQKELNYRLFWPLLPFLDALWIPAMILSDRSWIRPVFFFLICLHGGIMSPWSGLICFGTFLGRGIFSLRDRKNS